MTKFLFSILFGLVAAFANIIGGYIVSSQERLDKFILRSLLGLGAGFMLAAVFLEVIPRSFHLTRHTPLLILAGYLFLQLVEHTIVPHFHFGEETHTEEILTPNVAYAALTGLVLHTFFDGALIASGFVLSHKLGLILFLAIIPHKIPEGFTAASIMRASGFSTAIAKVSTQIIALSTLLGVLSISMFSNVVEFSLPFSAGVTLYVAASDLIPEVNREKGIMISIIVFVGVTLYFLTDALLSRVLIS